MVEMIAGLAEQAKTDQPTDMLLRSSLKMSGLQEEFAGEVGASDYASLAAGGRYPDRDSAIKNKSRPYRHKRFVAALYGFNGAAKGEKISAADEDIVAAAHLMPEPG